MNLFILLGCTALDVMATSILSAKEKTKPNFIVILTDDQGYNDLSCYGSTTIKTPNIDKLAKNGIRFTSFYAQPISGPSRTALMTGCYPLRVAEIDNQKTKPHPFVHPDEYIIPELLKPQGYISACIGKWDLNGHRSHFTKDEYYPTEMGFDYYYGMASSNDGGIRGLFRNKEALKPDFTINELTQKYTDEALAFIQRSRDEPFFLYLAHTMPHVRLGAGDNFRGKSAAGLYGDAVQEIDWGVGEIVALLKDLKLDKNTYIVYFSDNGPWAVAAEYGGSAYPLRSSKGHTWEGGVRVPGIISGADIKPKKCDQVVRSIDILPTIVALANGILPEDRTIDGQDLTPILFSKKDDIKLADDTYLYYFHTHLQAVRKGDWKLVVPRPATPEWLKTSKSSRWRLLGIDAVENNELYNLRLDISERRDVAADYPEIVDELMILIEMARNEIGDYNRIGTKARFFEEGERRTEAIYWQEKERAQASSILNVNYFRH